MGGSGRQRDAGVYRGAGALVDQGIVPKYFHGFNRAGKAGGDRSGHLYRGDDRAVVVRSGDNNTPGAGQGGGQIIGGMPMLEEGDGTGREDQEHAEDYVLDEASLKGNLGRIHNYRDTAYKYPGFS